MILLNWGPSLSRKTLVRSSFTGLRPLSSGTSLSLEWGTSLIQSDRISPASGNRGQGLLPIYYGVRSNVRNKTVILFPQVLPNYKEPLSSSTRIYSITGINLLQKLCARTAETLHLENSRTTV